MAYEIAVIPGDGIGNGIVEAVEPLLIQAGKAKDVELDTTWFDWGSERYMQQGEMMPSDGLDTLEKYDAILLGAVGHPDVPDHVTLRGLRLPITKGFQQDVCIRPTRLYEGVESPLKNQSAGDIDFRVYRQNTEGEYADVGGREHQGTSNEVAVQSAVFTKKATERIVRPAFEAASNREGHLTNVTKSNAQAYGMVFWDDVVEEVSQEYPDVTVERLLVDAASMDFVRRPNEFDVIVASNLFGDILTDIGGAISGSLGLAPSTNINPTGEYPSMFEPVHGSAFDIMGEGIANPIATILSSAMMMDHLGEEDLAEVLRETVETQLADPDAPKTPDIGGQATTVDVVNDIESRIID
ncbi:tartrate dehydrogenase [Halorubrum laminariae]|uniref:D-malate dehydrogenase (decarboxylating) n=1 Tax=Halorubrum laminariae TaxID=1433523 RepID=A0ABD6C0Z0_9EURY|nr:tartrate dehydrogenase [Halorubrum laminariae]